MITEFPYLQLIFKSVDVDVRKIFPNLNIFAYSTAIYLFKVNN